MIQAEALIKRLISASASYLYISELSKLGIRCTILYLVWLLYLKLLR